MDYLKLSLVFLLSFEFLCLVSSNPVISFFKESGDKVGGDDKTTVNTASTAKAAASASTTLAYSSSCGGLKGFLNICDKTDTTEPPKNVHKRSTSEESDSDSDSDESKSDEDSNEKKPSDVTVTKASSNNSEPTEREMVKRQADDLDASETTEASESEEISSAPEIPEPEELPLGLKKRQVNKSNSSSGSESVEEELDRQQRDCKDGPGDEWKDCKK